MASRLEVFGLSETRLALRRLGERTHKQMLAIVRQAAKDIAKEAALNAPIDEGDLESAIDVLGEERGSRGRLDIYVGVDLNRLGAGYRKYGHRYDIIMHEGMFDNLGPGSVEKGKRLGGHGGESGRVGSKYLTRAVDAIAPDVERQLERVKKEMRL